MILQTMSEGKKQNCLDEKKKERKKDYLKTKRKLSVKNFKS